MGDAMTAPGPILVRLPNWLGDALLARPLLHALRRGRPEDRVIGVAPPQLLALLATDAVIDDRVAWGDGVGERRSAAAEVRALRPGTALVLPPSFSSPRSCSRCSRPTR